MTQNQKPTRRPRGGQTNYAPDKGRRICNLIAVGSSLREAAAAEGVAPSTAHSWLSLHPVFAALYEKAKAKRARLMQKTLDAMTAEAVQAKKQLKAINRRIQDHKQRIAQLTPKADKRGRASTQTRS